MKFRLAYSRCATLLFCVVFASQATIAAGEESDSAPTFQCVTLKSTGCEKSIGDTVRYQRWIADRPMPLSDLLRDVDETAVESANLLHQNASAGRIRWQLGKMVTHIAAKQVPLRNAHPAAWDLYDLGLNGAPLQDLDGRYGQALHATVTLVEAARRPRLETTVRRLHSLERELADDMEFWDWYRLISEADDANEETVDETKRWPQVVRNNILGGLSRYLAQLQGEPLTVEQQRIVRILHSLKEQLKRDSDPRIALNQLVDLADVHIPQHDLQRFLAIVAQRLVSHLESSRPVKSEIQAMYRLADQHACSLRTYTKGDIKLLKRARAFRSFERNRVRFSEMHRQLRAAVNRRFFALTTPCDNWGVEAN